MYACAVILARGGSKGIKKKNLVKLCGKPLLSYPIEAALGSKNVNAVCVSSDDTEILQYAATYGKAVQLIKRPVEIAGDLSTDLEGMQHFLATCGFREMIDCIVHLRATFPLVTSQIIDDAIDAFGADPSCDSLRSVIEAPASPYKMWLLEGNYLSSVVPGTPYHSLARQQAPHVYWQNACVDVIRRSTIEAGSMVGSNCLPFVMHRDYNVDIDDASDLERVKRYMSKR